MALIIIIFVLNLEKKFTAAPAFIMVDEQNTWYYYH